MFVRLLIAGLLATGTGCAATIPATLATAQLDAALPPAKLPASETIETPSSIDYRDEVAVDSLPAPAADAKTPKANAPRGELKAIDLPTALQLADARNPQVAFTREQVRQAFARLERAEVLWMPSIRGGAAMNHHDGAIQDVAGRQFVATRNDFYGGLGASSYGVGSPAIPGIWANFQLADAIFLPLAAEQVAGARKAAVGAVLNDTLLQVAQIYFELLRAHQELAIAGETEQHAAALNNVTQSYARAGQGLQSDADRTATELSLRKNNAVRAEEAIAVASARLAQLLRLKPTLAIQPIEPTVVPLELTPSSAETESLIAEALTRRPELAEARHLVCEAIARWKRERYAPLVPSLVLGISQGGMSGGEDGRYAAGQSRFDLDAAAYWELRNFGLGDQAARREANSVVEQTRWRQIQVMDQVAREVTEALAQVRARERQIKIAEEGVKVARNSYRLNIERIDQAKGLPIEVLQSVQALDQTQREYLRTVIEYNLAQFALVRALGWPDRPVGATAASRSTS